MLTTWYLPRYDELSERLRASYQKQIEPPPESLPADERALVQPLLTDYRGDAEPAHRSYELTGYLKRGA